MIVRFKTLAVTVGLCLVVAFVAFVAGAAAKPHETGQAFLAGNACPVQFSWERMPVAGLPSDEYSAGFLEFE